MSILGKLKSLVSRNVSTKHRERTGSRRKQRAITIEQLENRAVFAAGLHSVLFATHAIAVNHSPFSHGEFSLPEAPPKFLVSFGKELDTISKTMKTIPKVPKVSKESIELLKSISKTDQWQPLTPTERFQKEAIYAANIAIRELLPQKTTLTEVKFVDEVLKSARSKFTVDGDNSLTIRERYEYIKSHGLGLAFNGSDREQNLAMASYLGRRFSSSYAGEVRDLAIEAYRADSVDFTERLLPKREALTGNDVQAKFNAAADYAADRAILDLREHRDTLSDPEFVAGVTVMARVRFMNEASSFLSTSEAREYLKAVGTSGANGLREYYSNRFDRDHLEAVSTKAMQAVASEQGNPISQVPTTQNPAQSTNVPVTNVPVTNVPATNVPVANGVILNQPPVRPTAPAQPLTVTARFEKEARDAAEFAIQRVSGNATSMGQNSFMRAVIEQARRRFASTAHQMLTPSELAAYQRAIRSKEPVDMTRYLANRFDRAHLEAVRNLANASWNSLASGRR